METKRPRHRLSDIDPATKTGLCSVCGPTDIRYRTDRASECMTVRRANQRSRKDTPERRRARWLRLSYGITPEHYATLLERQNGVCAICEQGDDRRLAVDHDHHTGRTRGLLCSPCNKAIGVLGDTAESVARAVRYLAA